MRYALLLLLTSCSTVIEPTNWAEQPYMSSCGEVYADVGYCLESGLACTPWQETVDSPTGYGILKH